MNFKKHIFCLEGEYDDSLHDRKSVLPLLQYLEATQDLGFIYRRTATKEEFLYYLEKTCLKKYSDFRFIFLAFHGKPNFITPSYKVEISLDEIAEQVKGRWAGKIIHFSSCETINISENALVSFREKTKAGLVSGYRKSIDFLDGAFMDMAMATLSIEYQRFSHIPARLEKDYPGLLSRTNLTFA